MSVNESLERRIAELEAELSDLRTARADPLGEGDLLKALLDSMAQRRVVEQSLLDAQTWFHLAQIAGGVAAYSVDFRTMTNRWSPSTYVMYGYDPASEVTFDQWISAIHPDDLPEVQRVVGLTTMIGEDVDHRFRIVRGDGAIRWIQDRGRVMLDDDGRPSRLIGINIDITDIMAMQDQLRSTDDFLGSVLDATSDCIKIIELDGTVSFASESCRDALGVDRLDDVRGKPWHDFWPIELWNMIDAALVRSSGGERYSFEGARERGDGSLRTWDITLSPIRGHQGEILCLVAVSRDVTEERGERARSQLLTRELHHRIKNSLATAQALARTSVASSTTLADFEANFSARLTSLSRVHAMIGDSDEQVTVRDVFARELQPFFSDKSVRIDGPDVPIDADVAVPLGMVVHELVTNACKYGGLGPGGSGLDVLWITRRDWVPPQLVIEWQEQGGTPAEIATSSGFGSKLTRRLVASLKGTIHARPSADGFRVSISLPLP